MTDSRGYVTSDLGKAAAIILVTGKLPDEYMRLDGQRQKQIVYKWDAVSQDTVTKLSRKELTVEPISFTQVYRELKNKTFEIIDGDKNARH